MNTKNKNTKPALHKERIAVVDGHPCTRNGINKYLRDLDEWDIAWECNSAEEALQLIENDQPDLMILEILLPGKDGLELIKHLKPIAPELKVLVHSMHCEGFYAERCLRAGAMGYLPKHEPMEKLKQAVTRVLHGDIYLSPKITRQTLHSIANHHGKHHDGNHLHDLTDRELEIMILMAQGHSAHHTAEKLHISPRTVQVHRNNIRLKIGLENSLQLHAYSVRFYGEEAAQVFLPAGVDFDRRKKSMPFN
jgi:DNA-binding NarL/FixJ family response regulator